VVTARERAYIDRSKIEREILADTQWTISRLMDWTREFLDSKGVDSPRLATELLLSNAMGCKKLDLYARFDDVPGPQALDRFRADVREAAELRPIAHLLGNKEFYSIDFEVTPDTLIPRPETELLVDQVLGYCRDDGRQDWRILDLGTGSGCIGVALCNHLEAAQVIASDKSPGALEVAGRNAERHGFQDRFTALEADGLNLPAESVPAGGFDILVSNPPYIAQDDPDVDEAVRRFEPADALFAEVDGLAFFRRIADESGPLLSSAATVFVEIGHQQHDAVLEIFTATQTFVHVNSWRDHLEGHFRVMQFGREGCTIEPSP
jgi:release factor glutamine methyltransferase